MAADTYRMSPVRFRAAKACKRCNQRRIKCDALEKGTPCTRCHQSNQPECVLLTSRRGTYPRKKDRLDNLSDRNSPAQECISSVTTNRNSELDISIDPTPVTISTIYESPQNRGLDNSYQVNEISTRPSAAPPSAASAQAPIAQVTPMQSTIATPDLASPESTFTNNSTASSYYEISWAAMFDRFLNNRKHDDKDTIDKCSITYLGESFPLSIVLADLKGGGKPRLHHAGPPLEETPTQEKPLNESTHPPHMLPEDITYLEAKQVFERPPTDILDALVSTFLDRFWPIYPIVLRQEVIQQHKENSIPWILLHSMCFVAATYCPAAILHRAGFASRKQARFAYYRKGKALFDTGYEKNKIVVLQAVIMLTFWGGGPNNYWNFYSWIGTGVTIAETLGMHRSLNDTNMKPQDRSLLKRLWWTLLIRDASCGALIGRPFRINMFHCDTEMMTEADFEYDLQSPEFTTHPQRRIFSLYQIHMTKLSLILRDIVATRFDPGKKPAVAANLNEMLKNWRQQLPTDLAWTETSTNMNIFASCLCIQYNHHVILTHMGTLTSDRTNSNGASPATNVRHIPDAAAHRISTLSCSIVTRSQVQLMSHEAFQGLFLAMVVFYTQMKSSQTMLAQLGRSALSSCQLVLHDAREAWDPSPWILKLFDNLTSNLEKEAPNLEMDVLADPFGDDYNFGSNVMNLFDGSSSVGLDLDPWHSDTTLGNLFGMSNETNPFQIPDYPALS